ncbi:MAG: cupredoxin domain-containing protein [Planctomycetota bacterium]
MQLKVDIGEPFEIHMREFQAQVLPSASFGPTKVWGYILGPGLPSGTQTSYIGPVVVATRHTPTEIKFFNNLPTSGSLYDAWKSWLDTSLHWADPGTTPLQVPAVPHLHGGEVPPQLDGGPDAWFTSGGTKVGHAYYSKDGTTPKNYATFRYPNTQEAANIWASCWLDGDGSRPERWQRRDGLHHPPGHPGPDVRHQRPALLPQRRHQSRAPAMDSRVPR